MVFRSQATAAKDESGLLYILRFMEWIIAVIEWFGRWISTPVGMSLIVALLALFGTIWNTRKTLADNRDTQRLERAVESYKLQREFVGTFISDLMEGRDSLKGRLNEIYYDDSVTNRSKCILIYDLCLEFRRLVYRHIYLLKIQIHDPEVIQSALAVKTKTDSVIKQQEEMIKEGNYNPSRMYDLSFFKIDEELDELAECANTRLNEDFSELNSSRKHESKQVSGMFTTGLAKDSTNVEERSNGGDSETER